MSIFLKPHNLETYKKVTEKIKETNKTAVIHPTGTGKMYIALKLLEENKNKKAIYIAPSNPILHDVKKNIFAEGMTMKDFPNLRRITYQKLARLSDDEIQKLGADIIILDEFHHCGAPEWGKGVQRLIEKNESASILGLSATPLRYSDGLRDMADELFENNVASEMTLEEAIEEGILPEASYVSTLYGYNNELENMQLNIDKIKDKDKRKEAQGLLNNLRDKLDENTQNLPELFSEHMKNKNGKYIIFCRNIEDMNEKMEQAQKMFGGVNSNITIRAVSSKVKKSDKILTEFEQDREEGTLKLLYAVDMLNEGYHIKDLDGVVMMRPTFSPTIYTQQLGRALTVGGDKRPVVFDLVNNFDSCKIIEDFAERMKQYKGKEGIGRTNEAKSSRLSIFDNTKEFREIAEKITELTKRGKVKLEQKIEIFEEFMKTGEELVGNTTFEGYPIGQWALQIRNAINRMNAGKVDELIINPTEEQLQKLESMGILERQIDSTIDEKIDVLIEWRRKYPKIKISPIATEEEFDEYAKTNEEFNKIQEEYEIIQRYYNYVRCRKSQGKLSEEQILKSKEGYIGGVFGYPTIVEELSKKYSITEKDIDYILTEYGTIDNFYEMHNTGKIESKKDKMLEGIIIKNVADIDDNSNIGYEKLYRDITGIDAGKEGIYFYSSKELQKVLEDALNEKQRYVIENLYGLTEEKTPRTQKEVGKEIGITGGVSQIYKKILRILKITSWSRRAVIDFGIENDEYLTDEEKQQFEEIKKDIQLQNGDLSENLGKIKDIQEKSKARKEEEERLIIEKEIKKLKHRIIESEELPIEELISFSYEDLLGIGIEPELATKINAEIEKYKNRKELDISNYEFSVRAYNCLTYAGIDSLLDLENMTEEQVKKIKNLGKKSFEEIVAIMQENGITFKGKDKQKQDEKESAIKELSKDSEEEKISNNTDKTELEENITVFSDDISKEKEDGIQEDLEKVTSNNNEEQKKLSLEDMTPEQLQEIISRNKKTIENNEETLKQEALKQELLQKILEQQKIIAEQQSEIDRLKNIKVKQ